MLFQSGKYPELRVIDVDVKFRDGVAEVSDEAAIERLYGLASLGVKPVEAVVEQRDADGPDEATDTGQAGAAGETADAGDTDKVAEPEKRKPGRPKKSDS